MTIPPPNLNRSSGTRRVGGHPSAQHFSHSTGGLPGSRAVKTDLREDGAAHLANPQTLIVPCLFFLAWGRRPTTAAAEG
jgi:hypothetical protein